MVMTVRGEVPAGELGVTLPHEHVYINLVREYRGEGLLHDPALMHEEVGRFAARGGRTIIDCTSDDIGRDPEGLRAVAGAHDLNIVMGCGYYRDPYIDNAHFNRTSTDAVAAELIRDLTEGVHGTGIRAGIIGEIGSDKKVISPAEERSFRAAARAHVATGVPITTHAARWPIGLDQLAILTSEGVAPEHVIIGHCDMVPLPDYHLAVARSGAYVAFDTIRGETEYDIAARVGWVVALVRAGHADRILLSQDICLRSLLKTMGGPGYDFVLDTFLPRLRAAGLQEEEIALLMQHNIARVFGA